MTIIIKHTRYFTSNTDRLFRVTAPPQSVVSVCACECVCSRVFLICTALNKQCDRMNRPLTVHECRTRTLAHAQLHSRIQLQLSFHIRTNYSIYEHHSLTQAHAPLQLDEHIHTIFRSMGGNDDANNFVNILLEPNKCQCSFSIGALQC